MKFHTLITSKYTWKNDGVVSGHHYWADPNNNVLCIDIYIPFFFVLCRLKERGRLDGRNEGMCYYQIHLVTPEECRRTWHLGVGVLALYPRYYPSAWILCPRKAFAGNFAQRVRDDGSCNYLAWCHLRNLSQRQGISHSYIYIKKK